jgi:hypothetical protein
VRQDELREPHGCPDIDVNRPAKVSWISFGECARDKRGGVIHKDVDPSALFQGAADKPREVSVFSDVALNDTGRAPAFANLVRADVQCVQSPTCQNNVGRLLREGQRRLTPNTTAAASDDDCLIGESSLHEDLLSEPLADESMQEACLYLKVPIGPQLMRGTAVSAEVGDIEYWNPLGSGEMRPRWPFMV